MKKLITRVSLSIISVCSLAAVTLPATVHAIPDKISGGICTAWGGSVVTDAVGKKYCDGGDFNGFDVID